MLDDKGHIRIIDFNTAQRDASTYNCFMFPIHYFPPPELVYQSRYGFRYVNVQWLIYIYQFCVIYIIIIYRMGHNYYGTKIICCSCSGEWWMVGIILYYMLTGVLPFGIIRVEEDESDEEFYSRCWNGE